MRLMNAVAFDTLKFVEKLEAGGFSRPQAKAAAEAFSEAVGQELATKADLVRVEASLKTDIGAVKAELKTDIAEVRAVVELARRDVTIRLGGMLVVAVGVLLVAMRFFAHG